MKLGYLSLCYRGSDYPGFICLADAVMPARAGLPRDFVARCFAKAATRNQGKRSAILSSVSASFSFSS